MILTPWGTGNLLMRSDLLTGRILGSYRCHALLVGVQQVWGVAVGILVLSHLFPGPLAVFRSKARPANLAPKHLSSCTRSKAVPGPVRHGGACGTAGGGLESLATDEHQPSFVAVWLVVGALIIALLILAIIDLLATRKYARRELKDLWAGTSDAMLDAIHRWAAARRAPHEPDGTQLTTVVGNRNDTAATSRSPLLRAPRTIIPNRM